MATILIVDDDVDNAALSAHLIESAGHRVRTAADGADGLRALKTEPYPDCTLLDVDMPVLTGPEMAHQMFLNDAGEECIPIILTSARDNVSDLAAQMGTPYFLLKASPDYSSALLVLVARALKERRPPTSA